METSAISKLAAERPGIQVSVVAGTSKDLLTALVERELDFVVCDISKYDDSPSAERISVIKLPSEPLVAVMSANQQLDAADLEEVARLPWALPTPAPFGARDLPRPFSEAFAAGRFPHYRLEATSACIELARAGHAITLVPRSLAVEACRNGDLKYYKAPKPLRTNDGIHFVRYRSRSSVAQKAIEAILEIAKKQAGAGS